MKGDRHLHPVAPYRLELPTVTTQESPLLLSGEGEWRVHGLRPLAGPGGPRLILGRYGHVVVVADRPALEALQRAIEKSVDLAEWIFG